MRTTIQFLGTPPSDEYDDKKLLGVYDFTHPGGAFEVHLRSRSRFFAPNFKENSMWRCDRSADASTYQLLIEWGKYGRYALDMDMAAHPPCCAGSAIGQPENWRTMIMKRPFTLCESKIMDSEWKFEHAGGSFSIEFHADGLNSFNCPLFPARAFWRIEDVESRTPTVHINWDRFGEYELKMAPDGESMTGSAKGHPQEWRKAERLGPLDETRNVIKKRGREGCGGCKKGCGECGRGDEVED